MPNKTPETGTVLRVALAVSALFGPLARPHLKRRVAKGKEDPERWREKLGKTTERRPDGPLVWMHGVGVGDVMALRGLIEQMSNARPELNFLVTSSARASDDIIARNLPPRTQHQFLPLDVPRPVARFLNHWKPDLAVWTDQEVWPRLAVTCARRGIPQALVAARLTKKSTKAKSAFGDAYGALYRMLDVRHAQDDKTAASLKLLMDDDSPVHVTGSIKAAGAPLAYDPKVLETFDAIKANRRMWLLASSHPADEGVALAAHRIICDADPTALLMIAPRDVTRADTIAKAATDLGLPTTLRSAGALPIDTTSVYIADTYGELGTWYRAAPVALIGGTFDKIEGHNPWEPAALGAAILHGPHVANFALDFKALSDANGCLLVRDSDGIAAAVMDPKTMNLPRGASAARAEMGRGAAHITQDLLTLLNV